MLLVPVSKLDIILLAIIKCCSFLLFQFTILFVFLMLYSNCCVCLFVKKGRIEGSKEGRKMGVREGRKIGKSERRQEGNKVEMRKGRN